MPAAQLRAGHYRQFNLFTELLSTKQRLLLRQAGPPLGARAAAPPASTNRGCAPARARRRSTRWTAHAGQRAIGRPPAHQPEARGRCRAAAAPNLRHPNDPAAEDGAAQPFLLPAVLMLAVGMAGASPDRDEDQRQQPSGSGVSQHWLTTPWVTPPLASRAPAGGGNQRPTPGEPAPTPRRSASARSHRLSACGRCRRARRVRAGPRQRAPCLAAPGWLRWA